MTTSKTLRKAAERVASLQEAIITWRYNTHWAHHQRMIQFLQNELEIELKALDKLVSSSTQQIGDTGVSD